jgi:UDP-glucuronate 4-epimerase
MKRVLVTGAAGFIGFHTVVRLLNEGFIVVGLDNINDYYDPPLKYNRLEETGIDKSQIKWYQYSISKKYINYKFIRMNLEDKQQLFSLFQNEKFDYVVNLAAQAGVRYSIENPDVYIQSNIIGFHNILEACKNYPPLHLVHASSSSVYGLNSKIPFKESDKTDMPVSLYATTKKSNELMAHSYSNLYGLNVTCLRFFTVYGPWGRPDMAPMLFANSILNKKMIKIFNNGNMERDFTYVDDIVAGISRILVCKSINGFEVFNLGNGSPVNLLSFIETMEILMNSKAKREYLPMQDGDVYKTWANIDKIKQKIDFNKRTKLKNGLKSFISWYNNYYNFKNNSN